MKQTLLLFLFYIEVTFNSKTLLADITSNDRGGYSSDDWAKQNKKKKLPWTLEKKGDVGSKIKLANCWMSLDTPKFFKGLDSIDARYATIRKNFQEQVIINDFDKILTNAMIFSKGLVLRDLYKYRFIPQMIPSGIQLGGYCMMKMPDSIFFFHRMKLRNDTFFRINSLKNDLADMVLNLDMSLNDLHLKGAFERALTEYEDPSVLIYAPAFGEVEFLLEDVKYTVEGRYRLLDNRLRIVMIKSEMKTDNVMMTYVNQAIENQAVRIDLKNLGDFMRRLRTDLDRWLKDYFNDYLMFVDAGLINQLADLEKYDREKTTSLAEHMDEIIDRIKARLINLNAASINVPTITFKAINGLQIKLFDGLVQGLDSIHRRDVATGVKKKNIRILDTIVGFSNLKVVYKYESVIPTGVPPLTGVMTLSANELSAHLSVAITNQPEAIDIDIEFLEQMKPESLTVEGAANLMISNFKHLLEHQIVSVMTNFLVLRVRKISSIPQCIPYEERHLPEPVMPEEDALMNSVEEELRTSNKSDVDSQVETQTETAQSSTKPASKLRHMDLNNRRNAKTKNKRKEKNIKNMSQRKTF